MSQDEIDVRLNGLNTSINPFADAPEGSAEIADNVILRAQDLVEPRRGYSQSAANPSGENARTFPWSGRIMTFADNGDLRDFSSATGWSSVYGTFPPPDDSNPSRVMSAAKSLFWTSDDGIYQLDELGGTAYGSGLAAPLPNTNVVSPTPAGFLAPGGSVAYRAVLCRYDANNNLIQSAPSSRMVVTNNVQLSFSPGGLSKAASPSVTVTATRSSHGLSAGDTIVATLGGSETYFAEGTFTVLSVPDSSHFTYADGVTGQVGSANTNTQTDIIAPYCCVQPFFWLPGLFPGGVHNFNGATFAQVYRSLSTTEGVTPLDELYLVAEYTLQALDFAASEFTISADCTPDSFLSQALYTNASTGGSILISNAQPPLARDMCLFNGYGIFANTTERQIFQLQLIGTQGLTAGTSTIIIAGTTYTAVSGSPSTNQFQLFTGGTPSQNVQNTAQSLCNAINSNMATQGGSAAMTVPIVAHYTSTNTGAPGLITLQEIGVGGVEFTVNAGQDGQVCWMPDLSKASYVQSSNNNRNPAKWWYSNPGQPWAVPPTNWAIAGAADQDLLRVIQVRQSVFFFKKDGLFQLTGNTPATWQLVPFDPDLVLLNPNSCEIVENQIFCWTNRGAVYVSEAGVSPEISQPIHRDMMVQTTRSPQYVDAGFGVAYENEGLWLYALPTAPMDAGCSQQFCFSARNPSWTRWTIPNARHGCFDPATQSIVWAVGSALWLERKSFTSDDFQDPEQTGTVQHQINVSSTTVQGGVSVGPGDLIVQGLVCARVISVDAGVCALDGIYTFAFGNVQVLKAINSAFKFVPIVCEDPVRQKRFPHLYASFKVNEAEYVNVGFDTDGPNATQFVTLDGPENIAWGSFPWGEQPWEKQTSNVILHMPPPQNMAVASTLSPTIQIQQAGCFWQLQGLKVVFDESSELPRR